MADMKNIAAAFVRAQKGFAPALKTNTNPAFRSKYVALDGCIEAVIDSLNANGIALLQPTHDCESGVTVETLFVHESGETMSGGRLHVPAAKQDPQGYGSALTYARRYSLMAACGIAPEDDDGNAASKPRPQPAAVGSISATGEAFRSLSPDWQAWVTDFATQVENTFEQAGPVAAKAMLEDERAKSELQAEHIAAIWSKLGSKARAAMKALAEKKAA